MPAAKKKNAQAKVAAGAAKAKAKGAGKAKPKTAGKAKAVAKPKAAAKAKAAAKPKAAGKTKAKPNAKTAGKAKATAKPKNAKATKSRRGGDTISKSAGLFSGTFCPSRWNDIGKIVRTADMELRQYISNNQSCTTNARVDAPGDKDVIPNISRILTNLSNMITSRSAGHKVNSAALSRIASESLIDQSGMMMAPDASSSDRSAGRATRSGGSGTSKRNGGFQDSRFFEPVVFRGDTHTHQGFMEKSTGRLFMNPN